MHYCVHRLVRIQKISKTTINVKVTERKQTLPSKIRVVTGSMAQTEAVTVLFRAGSRNESDDIAGISHLPAL